MALAGKGKPTRSV